MAVGTALVDGSQPDSGERAAPAGEGGHAAGPDLGAICDRYRSQAVGYAFAVLHDHATAEDAVQLAFARILARVAGGDAALLDGDPERVVIRNTRWAALELAERRRSSDSLDVADQSVGITELSGRIWERSQARQLCDQIAAELPAHYRDVLRMRFVEQHRDADAAARLRISLKAYRCRLDRALREARHSATRLGIDSLGGLVVVGWRAVGRRVARLQTAVQTCASTLDISPPGLIHGLVTLVLTGGLALLPLLAGGSGQAAGAGRLLSFGGVPGGAGGVLAAQVLGSQGPSALCARCDHPQVWPAGAESVASTSTSPGPSSGCDSCGGLPIQPALTGALPTALTSAATPTIPVSTAQANSLVGPSLSKLASAVGSASTSAASDVLAAAPTTSTVPTTSVPGVPAGGAAAVSPLPTAPLPTPTPSLP
ncbi:MAG: RNA polymerase sigma factor [Candidatus Dormibacteria bacterium]